MGGKGDFKTVFARVAAAGDEQGRVLPSEGRARHEHQTLHASDQARQGGDGLRALQRQQRLIGQGDDFATCPYAGLDVGDVARFARAVDDDEQVLASVDEHQIVDDRALVGQQQTVALFAHRQADHIDGHQRFKRGGGIGADQSQLAHVRHVKQTSGLAGVVMLGHQTAGVLHGHVVARKRNHARAQLQMQRVQGGGQQTFRNGRRGRGRHGRHHTKKGRGSQAITQHQPLVACTWPPMSALPERFAR